MNTDKRPYCYQYVAMVIRSFYLSEIRQDKLRNKFVGVNEMASFLKSCICGGRNASNLTEMNIAGSNELSDSQIEQLAQSIVATNMETIAIGFLKIQSETVTNLKIEHRGNTRGFNRAVLTIWKNMNSQIDQVQVSFQ